MTSSSSKIYSCYLYPLSLFAVIFLFTAYAFLNAANNANGDLLALLLLVIIFPRVVSLKRFPAEPMYFFWVFLALGLSSVFFAPSQYVDAVWFIRAVYRLLIVYFIFVGFYRAGEPARNFLRWMLPGLSFMLAILVLCNETGISVKESLQIITPLPAVNFEWNDKYYSFCLLFLTWSSIALLWRKNKWCMLITIGLLILTASALFRTGSESAQLAFIISLLVFGATHARNRLLYLVGSAGPLFLSLLIPLAWVAVAPLKSYFPKSGLFHVYAIDVRMFLYDFCANMIRKELVLGFGFGSTQHMPIPDATVPGWSIFPGGHPHNFVFLFFVEHGLLGFLFLAIALALFFRTVYRATENKDNGPAIWALLAAGTVIFSLSFAIWQADIVLMYGMFFSLLFMNLSFDHVPDGQNVARIPKALFFYGILCVLCYSVDYYFLHG